MSDQNGNLPLHRKAFCGAISWLHASNQWVTGDDQPDWRRGCVRGGPVERARQARGRILRHEEAGFGIQDEGCAVRVQFFFFLPP